MRTTAPIPIAFDDVGDGETALLCLPGWCGPRTLFRPLYTDLSQTGRVLALDWRGHGGSAPATTDFGTNELVDDALSVIEAAGVKRVVPVAVAHAGWVAIELRRRLGAEVVPAIVLLDWMVTGAPPPFLDALRALRDERTWSSVREKLFAKWTTGVAEPAVFAYVAEMGKLGFEMWSRAGREIAAAFATSTSPIAALDELRTPTLHLHAQPADAPPLRPWFATERLEASSHFPTLEVPGAVARAIATFVSERASRPV
jgi:pimeloyl-ACP methyl ester carboxylesterase